MSRASRVKGRKERGATRVRGEREREREREVSTATVSARSRPLRGKRRHHAPVCRALVLVLPHKAVHLGLCARRLVGVGKDGDDAAEADERGPGVEGAIRVSKVGVQEGQQRVEDARGGQAQDERVGRCWGRTSTSPARALCRRVRG